MKGTNNFPREGNHTTVTREAVKRLERERPTLNPELHYTIGGVVETSVHSNANAERQAAITAGSRRLNQASDKMHHGFEAAKPSARTEYIRMQRHAAMTHPARSMSREKGPSR